MKKFVVVVMIFSFLSLNLMGCATPHAGKGAAIGAVAGGILGAAVEDTGDIEGAIIGTFAGAIVGAVIGSHYDKQLASRAEAAKRYGYIAKEGKLVIEDSLISPQHIAPGSNVEICVQYTVLAPIKAQNIKVTEIKTISDGIGIIELSRREVVRAQGTHLSTISFTMPEDIERGDHILTTTISAGKHTKTIKDVLTVI